MTAFTSLRAANAARQLLWDPENKVSVFWRVNELAGETGEVCNKIKKLVRQEAELKGSRVALPELADEIADVIICADLVALTMNGETIPQFTVRLAHIPSEPLLMGIRLTHLAGRLCELFDGPNVPDSQIVKNRLCDITMTANAMLLSFGFAIEPTVSNKFNRTSEKVGFPTRLMMSPPEQKQARQDFGQVDASPRVGMSEALQPQRRVASNPALGMPYQHQSRERDDHIEDIARNRRREDERLLAEQGGNHLATGIVIGTMLGDDVTRQPDIAQSRAEAMEPRQQDAPAAPEPERYDPPAADTSSYDSGSSGGDSGGGGGD